MIRVLPVALLLLLAGCGAALPGPGTPAGQSIAVSLSNEFDEPARVDLAVIPPSVDGFEVTYENGSTRRFDVSSMDDLPPGALRNASGIDPLGVDAPTRHYALEPNSGIGDTIEGAPRPATIVFFLAGAGGDLRSAGVFECGPGVERTEVSIEIDASGEVHTAVHCRG